MSQFSAQDREALTRLAKQPYDQQAKQFMNAYWVRKVGFDSDPGACEKIWGYTHKFIKLDKRNGKEGCELDEFEAHQFLEKEVGAMTVKDMRAALSEISSLDFSQKMSLVEFLLFHYKISDWAYLVHWSPAGSAAQRRMLVDVQAQMSYAQDALGVATTKAEESKVEADKAAVAAEASAQAASASQVAAREQHEATLELEAQEKAKADALAAEQVKANDESLSTVKRNKAKAQLAILKSEDSQPLRRARITQEAAERKAVKAARAAQTAAVAAKKAKDLAETAAAAAERAMAEADKEVEELTDKLEEAKAACAGSGTEDGTFWWLDREFEESLKFMGPKQRAKAEAARAASRDKAAAGP
uniref:Calcium-regulated actin-bundling protein C-terminal domain-containing protein n=1 Tax=Chrysocystis fragilis TaxID=1411660 RepID=A0A7S0XQV2_9STRA|mmetsp:Transcript_1077/g.3184  ORF Transcript_1077/g.3184 Transcript_1077/m.3184 type:complete len:359 (+) Transcript_1077:127-1203(+)